MKKNITIKSNINKIVKIQYLHQNPNHLKIYFINNQKIQKFDAIKKPTLIKSGKIAMKKKKLLNCKIQ